MCMSAGQSGTTETRAHTLQLHQTPVQNAPGADPCLCTESEQRASHEVRYSELIASSYVRVSAGQSDLQSPACGCGAKAQGQGGVRVWGGCGWVRGRNRNPFSRAPPPPPRALLLGAHPPPPHAQTLFPRRQAHCGMGDAGGGGGQVVGKAELDVPSIDTSSHCPSPRKRQLVTLPFSRHEERWRCTWRT